MLDPAGSMRDISAHAGKLNGVKLRHFIVSFDPDEVDDPATADRIGRSLARYLAQTYPVVYAVHEDKPYLHIHLVMNAVSHVTSERYLGTREEFYAMLNAFRGILRSFGITRLQYVSRGRVKA